MTLLTFFRVEDHPGAPLLNRNASQGLGNWVRLLDELCRVPVTDRSRVMLLFRGALVGNLDRSEGGEELWYSGERVCEFGGSTTARSAEDK